MTCERCGQAYEIGDWPFCKGGHGRPVMGVLYPGDTIDEWNENVAPTPVHFTSRTEKRRYLKETGQIEFVRHVGKPGSDKSPHTTRWI
jgi:hypothetical protein